jgi:uncharacterized paraquat-inducible protein A
MNYRCPQCSRMLNVRSLFFHDISACSHCGQQVVLGDFLAFSLAALAMAVSALSALYVLSHQFDEYIVAAGYSVSLGMLAGLAVLLLLGRATPFRRTSARPTPAVRDTSEASPRT